MKTKTLTLEELQQQLQEANERNAALEQKNASLAQENEHLESSLAIAHEAEHQTPEANVSSFTGPLFDAIFIEHLILNRLRDSFNQLVQVVNSSLQMMNNTMTDAERKRMNSLGLRRYGFTDVVYDVSENENNANFYPSHANVHVMRRLMEQLETLRNLNDNIAQLQRVVRDNFMVTGNAAYQVALAYYNNVRVAARNGVPGAKELFDKLRVFFRNFGNANSQIVSEDEVLKDARGLLHGKRAGKVVIENEPDHVIKGRGKRVLDETGKNEVIVEKAQIREEVTG